MDKITIRPLRLRESRALGRLFRAAVEQHFSYFPVDYQRRVIADHSVWRLALAALNPRRLLLVAQSTEGIIGYAIGSVPTSGTGQLYWLYVEPGRRGSNVGLSLLSRMLKLQRELGAHEVTLATHDHRRYYERQGFVWRRTIVTDGVDLDIMTFPLEARP